MLETALEQRHDLGSNFADLSLLDSESGQLMLHSDSDSGLDKDVLRECLQFSGEPRRM